MGPRMTQIAIELIVEDIAPKGRFCWNSAAWRREELLSL